MASNQENFTYSVSIQADVAVAMAALRNVQMALMGVGGSSRAAQFGFGKMALSMMALYAAARLTVGMFEKFTHQIGALQSQFQRLRSMGFDPATRQQMGNRALSYALSGSSVMTESQILGLAGPATKVGGFGSAIRAAQQASLLTRTTGSAAEGRTLATQILNTSAGFGMYAGSKPQQMAATERLQRSLYNIAQVMGDPSLFRQFLQALNGFSTTMKENISTKGLDRIAALSFYGQMAGLGPTQITGALGSFQQGMLEAASTKMGGTLVGLLHLAGIASLPAIASGRPFAASGMELTKYLTDPGAFLMKDLLPKLGARMKAGKLSDVLLRQKVMGAFGGNTQLADLIILMTHLQAAGELGPETVMMGKPAIKPKQTITSAFAQFSTSLGLLMQKLAAPGLITAINALTNLINKITGVGAKHPAFSGTEFWGGMVAALGATFMGIRGLFGKSTGLGKLFKFLWWGGKQGAKGATKLADLLLGDPESIAKEIAPAVERRMVSSASDIFVTSRGAPNTALSRIMAAGADLIKVGDILGALVLALTPTETFNDIAPGSHKLGPYQKKFYAQEAQEQDILYGFRDQFGIRQTPPITVKVYLDGKEVAHHMAKKIITSSSHIPQASAHITSGLS